MEGRIRNLLLGREKQMKSGAISSFYFRTCSSVSSCQADEADTKALRGSPNLCGGVNVFEHVSVSVSLSPSSPFTRPAAAKGRPLSNAPGEQISQHVLWMSEKDLFKSGWGAFTNFEVKSAFIPVLFGLSFSTSRHACIQNLAKVLKTFSHFITNSYIRWDLM